MNESNTTDNIIELEGNIPSGERPKRKFRQALFSLFIFLIVMAVFYFASGISRLGVIYFDGDEQVSRAELTQLIDAENALFLTLNIGEIRERIERHPAIETVSISRRFPNSLDIYIVEQEIVVCVDIDSIRFYALRNGDILDDSHGIVTACDHMIVHGYDVTKRVEVAQEDDGELNEDEAVANEYITDFAPLSLFAMNLAQVDDLVLSLIQEIEYAPQYGDVNRFSLFMVDGNTVKVNSYTMVYRLNTYPSMLAYIEDGKTGVFHLDVGRFFSPHD